MTDSTAGASVSLVMMHLAFEAWSRYKMSLAVNWDVPGIKTIPGKKQQGIYKIDHLSLLCSQDKNPGTEKLSYLPKNVFFEKHESSITHA